MKVEQAIYGQTRAGHGLRRATDPGRVPSELTSRLDLPDTAPQGASWSPFLSGFPHNDRYVLARTFSDPTATRAGMVVSHAVIVPLDEITTAADLRPLLALLITTPHAPEPLETRVIASSAAEPPPAVDLVKTAEALTARGSGPVVRIGCEGFEDLVISLWFHLWSALRTGFAFRLSFGPQDLVDVPRPALVCTPAALVARWTGYRIIGSARPTPLSRAAAILSGQAGAEPVLRFAHEIGARLDNFGDLSLLERAHELASAPTATFHECVATLRLAERLSPDPIQGEAGKTRLVERLTSRLFAATVHDIILLRNLGAQAVPAPGAIWAGVRKWAARNPFPEPDDGPLLSAIEDATSTGAAIQAWSEALLNGIAEASLTKASPFPTAFWRWAVAQPTTLIALGDHLPGDAAVEARVAEAAPSYVRKAAADVVMALALSKRWLRLHGVAACATLAPHEAIRRQLSVDTDPEKMDGVRAAMAQATPSQAVAIALETSETRVLRIAAEEVAKNPELLKDADLRNTSTQDLWARALAVNAGAWQGPADPQQAFTALLDTLVEGGSPNADLIAALSSSPVADLSDYPRRAEVWHRVGRTVRDNLLNATAAGWLKRATLATVPYAPDRELERALLAGDPLDHALRTLLQTGMLAAVRIVAALSGYEETRFQRLLRDLPASPRPLGIAEAEALGRLVLDRRWQRAVDEILYNARKGRDDLKPALRICDTMVGIFDRWLLGLSRVSTEDKWQALVDVAADLYPNGPDDNELWDRAGGRKADLQTYGSGRARWHDAIRTIRRGKGPRVARLLQEMTEDYPSNEQLGYLASDRHLGGRHGERSNKD